MSSVEFDLNDLDDQAAINQAYREVKPWDAKCVIDLKRRIYAYHSKLQNYMCCYCQRDQYGEFKMVIDVEHILPKEKYRSNIFDVWNLSVSCKRCNMKIKGQRTDFLRDPSFKEIEKQESVGYYFVHPNFDAGKFHLERRAVQLGAKRLVKYVVAPGSEKGKYTYEYFRLRDLEIDSFDAAQSSDLNKYVSDTLDIYRTLVNSLRD
ncbi:HNH endonuclease [Burkholderia sp. MSMB1078WGS]|uniref:HNH endonuclease n=1 Tax=Burkholderia sp. MSMB1078WGS TaxID=1637900 RepID=UPI000B038CB6|nr:HNH endonuclease [Burkholderia sp. MSMB1078WGS]